MFCVKKNEKARKPSLVVEVDFGEPIGIKKSSAQISTLYSKEALVGKQIIANVNFAEKQIANFKSQCLILGAVDKDKVILLNPSIKVPNGSTIQ